jgi:nucleoside-diphosphate-sugar epimerase
MTGRKIFITGGTGKIGRIITDRLAEEGYSLVLLTRSVPDEDTHPLVKMVRGDILDLGSYSEALEGVDTVLHMAAVTHTNSVKKYFNVNAYGTRDLVRVSREKRVKRFVHISTRAISPGGGAYSRSKLEAEKYVRESGLDWIIVRPSEVYGLGGGEGIELLLDKIDKMPFVPVVGTGKYDIAPLHVSDLVEAIFRIVERQDLSGRIYTLAGPENFTYNSLVNGIMKMKNIHKIKIYVPCVLIKMLSYVSAALFGDRFLIIDQVDRLVSEKSDDISLAKNELSFDPKSLTEAAGI